MAHGPKKLKRRWPKFQTNHENNPQKMTEIQLPSSSAGFAEMTKLINYNCSHHIMQRDDRNSIRCKQAQKKKMTKKDDRKDVVGFGFSVVFDDIVSVVVHSLITV